ncbi:40-residue YVTN family beta-propeller repeat protein [Mycolicibacterium rhodesiae JS60]|nr:40-residue YVTN family beta-propeller repeat protein [Mycolicibacterium rhodesiae JS60]
MVNPKYIGRVGALAVALGVGVAIGNVPGVALADGASTESSSRSGVGQPGPRKGKTVRDRPPTSGASMTAATGDHEGRPGASDAETVSGELPEGAQLVADDEATADTPTTVAGPGQARKATIRQSAGSEVRSRNSDGAADAIAAAADAATADVASGINENATRVEVTDVDLTGTRPLAARDATRTGTALATVDAVAADRPSLIESLVAVPATAFARLVDGVVGLFERIVGPGAPLENAFLWAMFAWVRKETTRSLANRTPEIGQEDFSLVIDQDSSANVIGPLPATDADADTLTYSVDPAHGPTNGVVNILGNVVSYTPNADFVGEDSFTLIADDGGSGFHLHEAGAGHTDTAVVTVTVNAVISNAAPTAGDDSAVTGEDTPVVITVLANDTDPDNEPLTVGSINQPGHGTATLNPDGTVTYTPDAGFDGEDQFTYTVTDGELPSAPATVTVAVHAIPEFHLVATIEVGWVPTRPAVSQDDVVYVVHLHSNTVSVVDPATIDGVPATIDVGSSPSGVAVSPVGARAYVTNSGDDTVSVIDTATNTVTTTIDVGDTPLGVAVSPDGTRAYVTSLWDNTVTVIDTATNTVTTTIDVGKAPREIAVSPDGTRAYVTNRDDSTVSVIDTATNTVTTTIDVGSEPGLVVVSPDGTRAYVTISSYDADVVVIDTATNTVTATIEMGNGRSASGLAVSPDGARAYAVNTSLLEPTLSVIDTATNTVITTIDTRAAFDPNVAFYAQTPLGVAVSPDGTHLYITNDVSNKGHGTVSIIAIG